VSAVAYEAYSGVLMLRASAGRSLRWTRLWRRYRSSVKWRRR
jgi:hypothetical protein